MPKIIKEQAQLWKPEALEGISLFKAKFKHFEFAKHVHNEFAIGIIENGAQKFYHGGSTHLAPSRSIITVNPDEVHDGKTATDTGYQYRMAYIRPELISELLQEMCGSDASLRYFSSPVTFDSQVSAQLLQALKILEYTPDNFLEVQSCFVQAVVDLFIRHGQPNQTPASLKKNYYVVRKAREFMQERLAENISLEDISHIVGVSRFHFLRLFKSATGLSPHAYLLMRRLEKAKALIEQGRSLAEAAFEAGFADQSHMTRRFKTAYGITPGHYQKVLLGKK